MQLKENIEHIFRFYAHSFPRGNIKTVSKTSQISTIKRLNQQKTLNSQKNTLKYSI